MIKNYFKIAFRSFVKDRPYAVINLFGLAIALTAVLIIAGYVRYELSFDKYYSNSNRIYRVVVEKKKDSVAEKTFSYPDPLAYTLKEEFPEIESVSKLVLSQTDFIIDNKLSTANIVKVDSSFLQIFDLPFLYGNAKTALLANDNIVLTESTANKLFPKQNAIGRQLNYKDYAGIARAYTVTGIIKNIPANTHFNAEALVSENKKQQTLNWRAYSSSGVKYILLKKGADIKYLEKKISSISEKYAFPKDVSILFQPVTSIHLHSNIIGEPFENGDVKNVYIFSFAAFLILFVACINYINLTTARSLQRVKEVGIRKVMGAGRKQLAVQFISESVLFFCSALIVAFFIAHLLWPLFTDVADINAGKDYLLSWEFTGLIILLSIFIGIISGAYPAFFLSRLRPISILKDWQKSFVLDLDIRKTLIVFQFIITIALIVCTIVMHKQHSLLNNMQLGFNQNHLIILPFQSFGGKGESFKNELKVSKDILDVSVSSWTIGKSYGNSASMTQPSDSLKNWHFGFVDADLDFLKTMQIKLSTGDDFRTSSMSTNKNSDSLLNPQSKKLTSEEFANITKTESIIITKNTSEVLGLKEPVIGQAISLSALKGRVIGEIDNFIGISLLEKNPMVVIKASPNPDFGNTYIRINSKNIPQTIDFIKNRWNHFFPAKNFEFSFMDDQIADLYKSQQRSAILFTAFATLAIIISLMGLFSLVALTAQQKTKEIGIRKVLGASVTEIVALLSGSFIKLIVIAFVIAIPLVWWAMNAWLQDFQYRVSISWWIFLIAGLGSLSFALVVLMMQAIKAAVANPVKSLRTE